MKPEDMHNKIVDFGKHKGERWTRIPIGYLKWLVNETEGERHDFAQLELKRRGTVIERVVELSSHSIDRASLRCRKIWHRDTEGLEEKPGLYTWLHTVASEAYELTGSRRPKDIVKVRHKGMEFTFINGNEFPILKTITNKSKI
jgi:hypothetical protein